jgi:hypothetical protein
MLSSICTEHVFKIWAHIKNILGHVQYFILEKYWPFIEGQSPIYRYLRTGRISKILWDMFNILFWQNIGTRWRANLQLNIAPEYLHQRNQWSATTCKPEPKNASAKHKWVARAQAPAPNTSGYTVWTLGNNDSSISVGSKVKKGVLDAATSIREGL